MLRCLIATIAVLVIVATSLHAQAISAAAKYKYLMAACDTASQLRNSFNTQFRYAMERKNFKLFQPTRQATQDFLFRKIPELRKMDTTFNSAPLVEAILVYFENTDALCDTLNMFENFYPVSWDKDYARMMEILGKNMFREFHAELNIGTVSEEFRKRNGLPELRKLSD